MVLPPCSALSRLQVAPLQLLRVGGSGGAVAFSVSIDASTGATTLTQFLAVEHGTGGASHDEDSLALAANALQVSITATDFDLDSDTALVDLGSVIRFEDDGPRVIAAQNMNIQNSGAVSNTAVFNFDVGADGPNGSGDDIRNVTMTVNVNGTNVTATPVGSPTETATTAVYTYSFTYATNSTGGTATNSVVVTFDKVGDTYTVDLANPIQPFTTINSTSQATTFLGYDGGTTTQTNSQPDVVNVQLRADNPATAGVDESLWVRLTGLAGSPGTTDGNMTLTAGELITGGGSWVSASNTANGVAGDIVNQDEVLNIDLFTANQFGNAATSPTTAASAIYFKLDNIGNQEDFVVNLKLWSDTNSNGVIDAGETTTRAVYVAHRDMYKGGGGVTAGPGQYSGVPLDNNDALVIIESNDFNFGAENYRIIGAQIATTDQGLSGTAIDLNGTINAASTFDDNINFDSNDLGFKIQDIGFVSTTSTAQPATITMQVQIGDADGDTTTQTLVATISSAINSTSPAAAAVVPPVVIDLDQDGAEFLDRSAGVAYDYDGDGVTDSTGWVSADDGLLFRDANGNGTVDGASEFVFGGNGVTDLQALAAQYGSELNSSDADFARFGVWQDANSNGLAEAGEVHSLTSLGITSIGLTSDGQSYAAANGDVLVAGTGTYVRADGTTGSLADAAFVTSTRTSDSEQFRIGTTASNNVALAAAIAGAGLAAAPVAAHAPEQLADTAEAALAPAVESAHFECAPIGKAVVSDLGLAQQFDDIVELNRISQHDGYRSEKYDAQDAVLAEARPEQAELSALSQGTETATPSFEAHQLIADAIPSVEQLVALSGEGIGSSDGASKADVGRVLADALAGGDGHGSSIDSILQAVAEQEGAAPNADLAQSIQQPGDAPIWDAGNSAGFTAHDSGLLMHDMVMHPDAVQAAA